MISSKRHMLSVAAVELAVDERVSIGGETLYYGDTGTFSASDDEGKLKGIWTGRVTVNVKFWE